MRTPLAAVRYASTHMSRRTVFGKGKCLYFVRSCYGVASKYATATIAYTHTKLRGKGDPPRGAICWWTGGSPTKNHPEGAGHVALANGDGTVYTTDWGPTRYFGDGRVRRVKLAVISQLDNARYPLRYRGWSRDINGVRVLR